MIARYLRPVVYLWALPTTMVALPMALTAWFDGEVKWVDGVWEVHGGFTSFWLRRVAGLALPGGASAMTLGHIVLGVDPWALERTRRHERVHVRQCEWFGPMFLPAYLLCSLVVYLMGGDAYRQNPFERQAFEVDEKHAEK